MAARRELGAGFVSFLDVMCCGFGAVILLVVILNGDVLRKREQQAVDLRAELQRAVALEEAARSQLAALNQEAATVDQQQAETARQAAALEARVREASAQAREAEARARGSQAAIATLQAQSVALEQALTLLRQKTAAKWEGGNRPIGFSGDGQRQYLTGLKLGGERTLILLDASASMLDETVVNVLRWRLMAPEVRRGAPKWQRSVRTLHWLIANLRPGRQFQVYQFGTEAKPLIDGTDGQWLSTDDASRLSAAVNAARQLAPIGGTSLHKAFAAIGQMRPRPDSVILVTDGLPTQGAGAERDRLISADERRAFFVDATRGLPRDIPVNTLLLPMEGDPEAAGSFWQLALMTRGSFITPSRDWP